MPVDEFEPEGDDDIAGEIDVEVLGDDIDVEEIDVGVLEVDIYVGVMRVLVNDILDDVASEYDCFDCIHDESFLILLFLEILRFGPAIPWGVVPGVVGDAMAAGERLVVENPEAVEGVEGVEDVEDFEDLELDTWQSLSSPPHVEDPIAVLI